MPTFRWINVVTTNVGLNGLAQANDRESFLDNSGSLTSPFFEGGDQRSFYDIPASWAQLVPARMKFETVLAFQQPGTRNLTIFNTAFTWGWSSSPVVALPTRNNQVTLEGTANPNEVVEAQSLADNQRH